MHIGAILLILIHVADRWGLRGPGSRLQSIEISGMTKALSQASEWILWHPCKLLPLRITAPHSN